MESDTIQAKKNILEHLKSIRGDRINIAFAIWKTIEDASCSDKGELLSYAVEKWDEVNSDQAIEVNFISLDEKEALRENYAELSDAILRALVGKNLEPSEFYSELFESISMPIFPDEKAKAFAFFNMLIDRLLPYYKLSDGIAMSDPAFQDMQKSNVTYLKKIAHVLARKHQQRTVEASLLLDILDSKELKTERVVLLAYLLGLLKRDKERAIKQLEAIQNS